MEKPKFLTYIALLIAVIGFLFPAFSYLLYAFGVEMGHWGGVSIFLGVFILPISLILLSLAVLEILSDRKTE